MVTPAAPTVLVKSADRTLAILEILGDAREPVSVTDLHRLTGFPRSSLHQLLHTMAARRWVEFLNEGATVGVTSRALLTGTSYLDRDRTLPYGSRALERLREQTGYTTHYARLDGDSVLYLETRETSDSHRSTSRVGRRLPANATALGKALFAERSEREVLEALGAGPYPALTAHTITDPERILDSLARVRELGYAVEREENTIGISCVSAVVPYRIPATDAISCSIPVHRVDEAEISRVAAALRECVDELGQLLRSSGIR